ncbi:MAG TPA: pitrilysin family protein [Rickettsiales bacterium]|nr:pitrilysin family protein [Rickettsiales bacterium]
MIFSRLSRAARILLAAVTLSCFAQTAHAEGQPVETFALKNGMHVILIPNHRLPIVTHMLFYRVGSADDFTGKSGLAHYNEHMMFQGTQQVPAGVFARTMTGNGGEFNAFTERDFTAYYVSIAKEHLPLVMKLEADRMLHLAPTPANFAKEREVIIEERRMSVENQPEALLGEALTAMLFRNSPYHNPVIGWMHEMQSLTREDVLAFHKRFYNPADALLVVSGDVTRKDLEPLAQQYYGSLPRGEENIRHWRTEPPQRGARHMVMHHRNVKQPELVRMYMAPSVSGEEKQLLIPSFLVGQIVGGGQTSLLYQQLVVKQKLATGIDASYDGLSQGPGIFTIHATPAPGITLQQLETAVDKEIEAYLEHGNDAADLTRAKILLKADTVFARDGSEGMARLLGTLVMEGLPVEYFNQWPDIVANVKDAEVMKTAKAIFNPDDSVTGYLLPQEGK